MRVAHLIALLEDFNPDAEVHLMTQADYPLESNLRGVCSKEEITETAEDDGECNDTCTVVYLVEGEQIGYGIRAAWEVCTS